MKSILFLIPAIFLILSSTAVSRADELTDLLDQVEKLNITLEGYTLGKALSQNQEKMAAQNIVNDNTPDSATGTYKFKDKNFYIVADKLSHRVIILYEQYDNLSSKKMQEIVGNLFYIFGDPTVMAHDKIIYWAYGNKGRISEKEFSSIKENKKQLHILATVKLNSSKKIMELKNNNDNKGGSIYYIISSEPVLKLIKARKKQNHE
ncbi:hypothetical protein QUF70_09555 [Desulfobacterales bacterium HSG17]|nr:hypothetical protein [Desulfobacterales bacterium HSG17]